jgi:hypothetical protein
MNRLTHSEAQSIVGTKAVKYIADLDCHPTDRLTSGTCDDGFTEFEAVLNGCVDKDGISCNLHAVYFLPNFEVATLEDLSLADWEISHFEIH